MSHESIRRQNFICEACGIEYAASDEPMEQCTICEDERQYVNAEGQSWTTLEQLTAEHQNEIEELEPGLTQIRTEPKVGIGQRCLLVQTPAGNVLWDCISLIDDTTVAAIEALGGISAITLSHPHMFGSMIEWSHAFGNVPVFVHAYLERWIPRPDPVLELYEGETCEVNAHLTLHLCGGHFKGSTVLHWPDGSGGRGSLLSSDTIFVVPDRRHVTFMYSYPNYIPLGAAAVDRIVDVVSRFEFDRIYSNFDGLQIDGDARNCVLRSAERFKHAIGVPG